MSLEMFQGPSFQENIKFPHNDVERGSFQSICRRTKKCNQNFNFFCFGKQRQIMLFSPDLQTINHKLNLLPLTMLVDIEERRRKIRVSPIFPKYFQNISGRIPFTRKVYCTRDFSPRTFALGKWQRAALFFNL